MKPAELAKDPGVKRALIRHVLPLLFFLLISILIFRGIIGVEGDIVNDDLTRPSDIKGFFEWHYPSWNEFQSTSMATRTIQLPLFIPFILIALILGLNTTQMIVMVYIFTEFLAGAGMFYASRYVMKRTFKEKTGFDTLVPLIAALAYSWNLYVLFQSFHPYIKAGFAVAPVILLCIFKALDTKRYRFLVLAGLLWSFACGDLHWAFYGALLFMGFIFMFNLVKLIQGPEGASWAGHIIRTAGRTLAHWGALFGSLLLFSAHWLVPGLLMGGSARYGWLLTKDHLIKWYDDVTVLGILRDRAYHFGPEQFYRTSSALPSSEAFLALLTVLGVGMVAYAFLALVLKPKNIYTVFFVLFFIGGFFITTMVAIAPNIGTWLILEAPLSSMYGWAIRTPKTSQILIIAICFLITITTARLLLIVHNRNIHHGFKKGFTALLVMVLLASIILPAWPLATGDSNGTLTPSPAPDEFGTANEWLKDQDGDFRVLWIPKYHTFDVTWNDGKRTIKDQPAMNSEKPTYLASTPNEQPNRFGLYHRLAHLGKFSDSFIMANATNDLGSILEPLAIKYVLIHDDIPSESKNVQKIIRNLEYQEDLVLVKQFGFITIFKNTRMENSGEETRFFASSKNLLLTGGFSQQLELASLQGYDPMANTVVFANQFMTDEKDVNDLGGAVVFGPQTSLDDLIVQMAGEDRFVFPFHQTTQFGPDEKWSKIRMVDIGNNQMHRTGDLGEWAHELEAGVVYTWSAGDMKKETVIPESEALLKLDFETGTEGFESRTEDLAVFREQNLLEGGYGLGGIVKRGFDRDVELASSERIPVGKTGGSHRIAFDYSYHNVSNLQLMLKFLDGGFELLERNFVFTESGARNLMHFESDLYIPPGTRYIRFEVRCDQNPLSRSDWFFDNILLLNLQNATIHPSMDVHIPGDGGGEHRLFLRCLKGENGGEMTIEQGDTRRWKIRTYDRTEGFRWLDLGTIDLTPGGSTVTLENIFGFNAVNALCVIPADEYARLRDEAAELMGRADSIHIIQLEDVNDFEASAPTKVFGSKTVLGRCLKMDSGGSARFIVDVPRNGSGNASLLMSHDSAFEEVVVSIGNSTVKIEGGGEGDAGFQWHVIPGLDIQAGPHQVRIRTVHHDPVIMSESFEEVWETGSPVPSDNWTEPKDGFTAESDPATSAHFEKSLKLTTDLPGGNVWSNVMLDPVDVQPGGKYFINVQMSTSNADGSHVKITGQAEESGDWMRLERVTDFISGDSPWSSYRIPLTIPENISKVQVVLMAGGVLLPGNTSASTWFDNVKLVKDEEPSEVFLDQFVLLVGDEERGLEEFFADPLPGGHLEYKKIDSTRYEIKVDARDEFMLVMCESYERFWVAEIDGKEIKSTPVYGMINGFKITKRGNYTITVRYKPQTWLKAGAAVSLAGGAGMIALLILADRRKWRTRGDRVLDRFFTR